MPYEEVKSERYSNLGGLNTKVSRYLSGQQEVIRLVNYDYSTPGSFTKRPDTATFLGASFGPRIRGLFEFTKTSGESWMLIQSTTNLFSFGVSGPYQLGGNALAGTTGRMDVVNYANWAWITNQWNVNYTGMAFYRFNGNVLVDAQPLPPPYSVPDNFYSVFATTSGSSPILFATLSGFRYSTAYLTDRDVVGTANGPAGGYNFAGLGATMIKFSIANALSNVTANGISYLLVFRENLGYTAIQLNSPGVALTTAVFKIPLSSGISQFWDAGLGFTDTATYLMSASNAIFKKNSYYPFYRASISGNTGQLISDYGLKQTGYPTIINTYNNMVFYSGFPLFPSHVFWSQIGEPMWVDNEDYNEVRTNDGDVVRAMVSYDGSLIVAKQMSIHVVTGDDPDTVSFSEKNNEYGFMNNRAFCIWEDILWFLDGSGKGVCQYNGANTSIVSIPVEDIFKRINLNAAFDEAWMLHVKSRNEVWCGIPVDSSALVNTIVVYDYVSKVWTTFEGLSPTAITIARGTLSKPSVVMGFSNGTIKSLNATFMGTEAVTTAVRFPFVSNFGWSSTETYRRFFLDVDPIVGVTHSFAINYYLNQSNTVSQTGTISTSAFQTRTDFGLPGKGLSVELVAGSSLPVKINGYTIESRFQRNV